MQIRKDTVTCNCKPAKPRKYLDISDEEKNPTICKCGLKFTYDKKTEWLTVTNGVFKEHHVIELGIFLILLCRLF